MEIKFDNTETIVFRNGGSFRYYESWSFRDQLVNTTAVYKYMSLLFTLQLSWNVAHDK
jgi:hypothetical protein